MLSLSYVFYPFLQFLIILLSILLALILQFPIL